MVTSELPIDLKPPAKRICPAGRGEDDLTQPANEAEATAAASSGLNQQNEKKVDGMSGFAEMAKIQREQMEFMQHTLQQNMFQQQQMMSIFMERMITMIPQQRLQDPMAPVVAQELSTVRPTGATAAAPTSPTIENRKSNFAAIANLVHTGSVDAAAWSEACLGITSSKLTADDHKAITEVSAEFRKSLNGMLNSEQKLEALKSRQESLNKSEIPAGMKPYSDPWTIPSLDLEAAWAGTSLSIPVPGGTTLGELRELLYIKYHSLLAAVDIEIWTHRKAELAKDTSFNRYLQEIRSKTHAAALGLKKFTEGVEAPPGLLERPDDAVYAAAAKKFATMVNDMAHERAKTSRDKQKELEKREKEKDKVLNMSAEEVLEAKFKTIAEKFNTSKTKNGLSPGATPGHNAAQSSGKGTAAPKSHGKGKGKPGKGRSEKGKPGKGKSDKGAGKGKGPNKQKGYEPLGKPFWQQKGKGKGSKGAQKKKGSWP
jgi:hypothetical protein